MNFKNLIPEGVLNPAPSLHKTTQEDLDRMQEELENAFNPEPYLNTSSLDETNINKTGWKQKEYEELPKFKNKVEFMQAKAIARKIINSQKPKKKKRRKK
jgi:hypothetical protein